MKKRQGGRRAILKEMIPGTHRVGRHLRLMKESVQKNEYWPKGRDHEREIRSWIRIRRWTVKPNSSIKINKQTSGRNTRERIHEGRRGWVKQRGREEKEGRGLLPCILLDVHVNIINYIYYNNYQLWCPKQNVCLNAMECEELMDKNMKVHKYNNMWACASVKYANMLRI